MIPGPRVRLGALGGGWVKIGQECVSAHSGWVGEDRQKVRSGALGGGWVKMGQECVSAHSGEG